MKRNLVFTALLSLFVLATAASAQKATNFGGTWNLDVSKSKPAETRIESQTLTVTQTATDIKVERATKAKENPNAGGAAAGGGGGGRGPGMGGGGDAPQSYTLDGKAVKSQMQSQAGGTERE